MKVNLSARDLFAGIMVFFPQVRTRLVMVMRESHTRDCVPAVLAP